VLKQNPIRKGKEKMEKQNMNKLGSNPANSLKQAGSQNKRNAPIKKIRAGAVSATIWENEGHNDKGEAVAFKNVSFERSYKDSNGEWQTTNALRMSDLPRAVLVLNKAYEFLAIRQESEE
jgi:hypothetical protein